MHVPPCRDMVPGPSLSRDEITAPMWPSRKRPHHDEISSSLDAPNERRVRGAFPVKWVDTVRPWKGSVMTGVELITAISPDMIGIRFRDDSPASAEEREDLIDAGLRFKRELRAYVTNMPPAGHPEDRRFLWERLEALYWRIHERRATRQSWN